MNGQWIEIDATDSGAFRGYLSVPVAGKGPGIILCQEIAKENTNQLVESYKVVHNWYLRPGVLWLMPKAEYTNNKLVRNCLKGRGHNVIN